MPKFQLSNAELASAVSGRSPEFPKYTTQIMNLANQNAQGTRPKVVGQMTELFREFGGKSFSEWDNWYQKKEPEALDDATDKVYAMVERLQSAIQQIDKAMVREWVEDLVVAKTFVGLCFEEAILSRIAEYKGATYRLSTPAEESQGIDGFIGDTAVSIKPSTYSTKDMLGEELQGKLVIYEKKKNGITFSFDF